MRIGRKCEVGYQAGPCGPLTENFLTLKQCANARSFGFRLTSTAEASQTATPRPQLSAHALAAASSPPINAGGPE